MAGEVNSQNLKLPNDLLAGFSFWYAQEIKAFILTSEAIFFYSVPFTCGTFPLGCPPPTLISTFDFGMSSAATVKLT